MRNSMGEELTCENDIEGRWKEYFVQLQNGDEIREVGGDIRKDRIGENERVVREMVREEIMVTLKNMKGGKAVGMDGIVVEMLKNGGISIIDWLLRIFNKCMESGVVTRGLEGSVYHPGIQREGDKRLC